ncbi:MAG: hypothetical protein JXB17_06640, partial [Bacteroidales bacterium]|nr:hypothetical protein [Bacteroidales bacterium]
EFYLNEYKFVVQDNLNPYSQKAKLNIFNKSSNFVTSLNPFGFFYKDSLFSISVKPIWGINFWMNDSGNVTHTWGGAELKAGVGKHVGFYASLRDNHINKVLAEPGYYTQLKGGAYQHNKNAIIGADFNEMIGGIILSWNWGEIGLVKDNIIWGDNYNGANILSGRTPSFPMIKFHINPAKWFDFNYFHGWLVSEVIDSSRLYVASDGKYRKTYINKYMAGNMFTLSPFKGVNISLGNSIIYSDMDLNPAYLIPFMFYKSIDHTLNHSIDNQNSQLFGNISLRAIKHFHIYSSLFIDELNFSRIFNDTLHNFYSFKIGSRLSNWPIRNISITGEFTRTSPLTFQHRLETLSFESNQFNLGHYLTDNSQELFAQIRIKPFKKTNLSVSYLMAKHGNIYEYRLITGRDVTANPVLKDITWENESITFKCSYEFLNNSYLRIEYYISNIQGHDVDGKSAEYYLDLFTPEYLQGKQNTLLVGFNFGF